jgi:hypothetical protein
VLGEPAKEDAGVGPNPRLGVGLGLGEVTEEIVVEDALGQLGGKDEDRLDGRLADDGDDVAEA